MGRTAERTARRRIKEAEFRKQLKLRKERLKALGYEAYKSGSYNGEESWCYLKEGKRENGSAWDGEHAVILYLEDKLNLK